jgi:hypothetical protein
VLAGVRGPAHQLQLRLRAVGRWAPLDADVRREQVAGHVDEAMENDELRRSTARWEAEARPRRSAW